MKKLRPKVKSYTLLSKCYYKFALILLLVIVHCQPSDFSLMWQNMQFILMYYFCPQQLGVRDYIHIMDLASGHVAALKKLQKDHLRMKVY